MCTTAAGSSLSYISHSFAYAAAFSLTKTSSVLRVCLVLTAQQFFFVNLNAFWLFSPSPVLFSPGRCVFPIYVLYVTAFWAYSFPRACLTGTFTKVSGHPARGTSIYGRMRRLDAARNMCYRRAVHIGGTHNVELF